MLNCELLSIKNMYVYTFISSINSKKVYSEQCLYILGTLEVHTYELHNNL